MTLISGDLDIERLAGAIGRELGLMGDNRRYGEIRIIVTRGEPNVIEMVRKGLVGIQAAYHYVRKTEREVQATATPEEVAREGNRLQAAGKKARKERRREKAAQTRDEQRQRKAEARKATIERRRSAGEVTEAEFERPAPELMDQQYPGREEGVTYAHVHREQHGHIFRNLKERRRADLRAKLTAMAHDFTTDMGKLDILDERERQSILFYWRRAIAPFLAQLTSAEEPQEPAA